MVVERDEMEWPKSRWKAGGEVKVDQSAATGSD